MKKFLMFYLASLMLLNGCAVNKPMSLADGRVIAVSVDVDEGLKRHYMGLTAFTTENRSAEVSWGGAKYVEEELLKHVSRREAIRFVERINGGDAYVLTLANPSRRQTAQRRDELKNRLGGDVQYLMRVSNGNQCTDPMNYCSNNMQTPLVTGSALNAYLIVALTWSAIDVLANDEVYSRRIQATIQLDDDLIEERPNDYTGFANAIQCMTTEIIKAGVSEIRAEPSIFVRRVEVKEHSEHQLNVDASVCAPLLGEFAVRLPKKVVSSN